jgi:hypothetical protein
MKITLASVVRKIEADLEYRLPQSNKQLSSVLLSRDQAEVLLRGIDELRVRAGEKNAD